MTQFNNTSQSMISAWHTTQHHLQANACAEEEDKAELHTEKRTTMSVNIAE
jgi:hypothetical protein